MCIELNDNMLLNKAMVEFLKGKSEGLGKLCLKLEKGGFKKSKVRKSLQSTS